MGDLASLVSQKAFWGSDETSFVSEKAFLASDEASFVRQSGYSEKAWNERVGGCHFVFVFAQATNFCSYSSSYELSVGYDAKHSCFWHRHTCWRPHLGVGRLTMLS